MAGRVDFADTLTQRGYQVNISDILRQYAFGTQKEHFAVLWLGDPDTPGDFTPPYISSQTSAGFPGSLPDGGCEC